MTENQMKGITSPELGFYDPVHTSENALDPLKQPKCSNLINSTTVHIAILKVTTNKI